MFNHVMVQVIFDCDEPTNSDIGDALTTISVLENALERVINSRDNVDWIVPSERK